MFFSSDAFGWIWLIIAQFFFSFFVKTVSKVTSTFYCKSSIDITNSTFAGAATKSLPTSSMAIHHRLPHYASQ